VSINKMAGWCLILLGVINVLHEISLTSTGRGKPGLAYALTTSIFFTAGAVLLCWQGIRKVLAKQRESRITVSADNKRAFNQR
jgi:predicted phage tail protein